MKSPLLLTAAPLLLLAACSGYAPESAGSNAPPLPPALVDPATIPDVAIRTFFEDYDRAELAASPISKSYRGIRDADYGKWDDASDAAAIAERAREDAALARLQAEFDPARLNANNALSLRLFAYAAARGSRAFAYRDNGYIFDQMNGAQSEIPAFLINIHRIDSPADAEAYIARLRGIESYMGQLVALSRQRADKGVIVPDWVFPYVIADARNVISGAPFDDGADSVLLADFRAKLGKLAIADIEKEALIAAASDALVTNVKPAYLGIIAEMERQQALGPVDDGVWRFANGAEYYAERLQNYTTTKLSADEIHQIGLDNVARIHGEMRVIMAQVGFAGSLQEFFAKLRGSDEFFHSSREAYLAEAEAKISAMEAALPGYFNTLPKAPLVVKPVEAFREQSAGKAFYQRPAPDGSRPGTYYVNLFNLRDMSKTELEALAYHEGLPGHHLQLAIQTELGDLPPFRRFGGVTAYSEGWGLYSEKLGKDMGFYTDPYSDFGRLGMELWRACRLVVDTGIHHKRWSREEAIAYLTENTPNPPGDIQKAIERYVVFPGQATAYTIGMLKILELRDRAQAALGERFTMGNFHDAILRSGPVPLEILEERVDAWIAAGGQ